MKVLKLGGSLLSSSALVRFLELSNEKGRGQLVIVPGGGPFAEQVRLTQKQWDFDDKTAHHMALLAMQQMALLFQGLCPDVELVGEVEKIVPALKRNNFVVWFPLTTELDVAGIPASWDVTSDSLAAWLAIQLAATELILVKSAKIPVPTTFEKLSTIGLIDKAFVRMVENNPLTIKCISSHQSSVLASCLNDDV